MAVKSRSREVIFEADKAILLSPVFHPDLATTEQELLASVL
jgi:hypothetical protein